MYKLGVNIDHIATIREARKANEPDPVWAAAEAELGGADGITFHLREDRRHINDRDAELLKRTVACKLNMEMANVAEIVRIALELKPEQCTLVPERREEITTEGGLNVVEFRTELKRTVGKLRKAGIEVSAFVEPDEQQIEACKAAGFDAIELWTGGYANAKNAEARFEALQQLGVGIEVGLECDLVVHAGHGLTYRNIDGVVALGGFSEFNIGHSIVARAAFVGMREAVREMKRLIDHHALLALNYPVVGPSDFAAPTEG